MENETGTTIYRLGLRVAVKGLELSYHNTPPIMENQVEKNIENECVISSQIPDMCPKAPHTAGDGVLHAFASQK